MTIREAAERFNVGTAFCYVLVGLFIILPIVAVITQNESLLAP
jgi:hypothetical protein